MKTNEDNMNRAIRFACNANKELAQLDELIGMESYKKAMREMIGLQKRTVIAHIRGHAVRVPSYNMCFLGNPGTGKTSIGETTADIFYRAGIVNSSKPIVVGRSDLVGEHVGETALKTKQVLAGGIGHVVLIDEAYALMDDRDGSFGDEAINTLVEVMENCRGKQVLIFAGYWHKMQTFLDRNPGLRSRIPFMVHFEDYSSEQLYRIAEKFANEDKFSFHPDVRRKLISIFDDARKSTAEFGNARYARNLIERAESRRYDCIDFCDLLDISDLEMIQLMPEDFEPIETASPAPVRKIGFV